MWPHTAGVDRRAGGRTGRRRDGGMVSRELLTAPARPDVESARSTGSTAPVSRPRPESPPAGASAGSGTISMSRTRSSSRCRRGR
jgi:hypothetical protein